jgi:aminopeptidase N
VRRTAALALTLVAAAGSARADTYPRQPGIDVLHYAFRLALADETDAIEGEATVQFRVLQGGLSEIVLDLAQASPGPPGRGMTVASVTESGAPLRFAHAQDRLQVALERPGRAGEQREVVVRYSGAPAAGLLVGPNKHGDRTFFSDNWPDKARQWLPVVDHPYEKATSEFRVTAPARYQVVSNGLLVEETDLGDGRRLSHWRESVPIAPWLYALGVARFAVAHRPAWSGIPIETWVYPQDRDRGFEAFAEPTVAALDFFSARIGPYSYERLANVQANGVKGGMESATSIFYGDDSVVGPRKRWRSVVVHEIAHQWFGNAVTEGDWDDVWLSEGFATYFTHLFVEHAEGRDAFVAGLRADRDQIRAFDEKNPGYRIVHDNLADMKQVTTGPGTYKKGAWTLHMLRGVVGDEAFWSGIREYYRLYRDRNASTGDFRRVMEEASGRELAWFFDEWLLRGGMLKVRGRWAWDATARTLRLDLEQLQAAEPYRMPVELAIDVAGDTDRRTDRIELRERRQGFTLPLDREPRSVALDPRDLVLMDAEIARADIALDPRDLVLMDAEIARADTGR